MDGWVGLDGERLLSPIMGRPLDSFIDGVQVKK